MMTEREKDKYYELGSAMECQIVSADILDDATAEWKKGNVNAANALRTVSDKVKARGEQLKKNWDEKYPKGSD